MKKSIETLLKISKEDLAYMAGFLDGEGCITVQFFKTYILNVIITNTNQQVLEWISETFGGGNCSKPVKYKHYKPCWRWQVSGRYAILVLKLLLPFLKVKKAEALVALEFENTYFKLGFAKKVPDDVQVKRSLICSKLKELK